jgi:hypothetical protein
MALKFYWGLENNSTTLGSSDYSAGDTIADTHTGNTFGAAGAKLGSYGLIGASGSAANTGFDATTGILGTSGEIDQAVGSCGYWWQAETVFPGNNLANGVRLYNTAVANGLRVMSVTGSKLRLLGQNAGAETVQAAPATALSAGTWYFLICRWDVAGDKIKFEIYEDAGGSTLSLTDSAETTSGVQTVLNETDFGGAGAAFEFIQFGVKSSSTASRIFTDNILVCDTYDALIQSNAFITDYSQYSDSVGHPAQSRARGIPGMNTIASRFGRGW